MKLGMLCDSDRSILAAPYGDEAIDLSACGPITLLDAVRDWDRWQPVISEAVKERRTLITGPLKWAPPIAHPPKFLLLAGNFRAHVEESGFAPLPPGNLTPQFFSKPSTTIIGSSDTIPLTNRNVALDYEAELAVIVGRSLKQADAAECLDAVFGYTVVNDISERRLNSTMEKRSRRDNDQFFDWLTGKWFDGSAPMGPFVLTADEFPAAEEVEIRAVLNDEVVQQARVAAMVHDVAHSLSYISEILTLEPGDVISM